MKLTKIIRGVAITLVLLLLALIFALWVKPPEILRVGANYSAKIVCSNVFLAGRDPDEVLRADVQAPGVALLHLMRVSVDRERRVVRAGLLGFIGDGLAVARPGTGCAAVSDGNLGFATHVGTATAAAGFAAAAPEAAAPETSAPEVSAGANAAWPLGDTVATTAALDRLLADDTLAGPGMRAIVVAAHGRIVAERYGAGFSPATPLLGWSMTKSVVAGLVGILVKEGRLTLDQSAGWSATEGGGRERIRISDLLAMTSGLRFNEAYGDVSDVTRMLYLQPDMAGFARAQPLAHPAGEYWSYSSGTANILARIVQDAGGRLGAAYAREKLFKSLGMNSATIETDEDGTLVGSSYMYATARDWAKYGQFLVQDGVWRGQEMLPRGYVAMMATPVAPSGGQYGRGLVWLWGSDALVPGKNPDTAFGIPADTFWMEGHDGQTTAIIPSRELVIVRLGLTPARDHYLPQPLVKAVLDAVHE
ncbi:MAG TPA: serine hydrolase [Steroidobacteraceae bacterium]|jgi:CubicO group peptidase (beta-lactamase class C family)|nr:serine hydrolase [Steroidobacteraceae bacterium]